METGHIKALIDKVFYTSRQRSVYRVALGNGDGSTVYVANRGRSWVWGRFLAINTGTPTEILCTKISPLYGAIVRVEKNIDGYWEVMEFEPLAAEGYAEGQAIPNVAAHGWTHGFYGSDPMAVDSRQLQPLQTWPTDPLSLSVNVGPLAYLDSNGDPAYFAGGTLDLTSYVPTSASQQRIVIVGLNRDTGALVATAGSPTIELQGNLIYVPYDSAAVYAIALDLEIEPSAPVRLYYGQTTITNYDIFLDMRRWLGGSATGTASSLLFSDSGLTAQEANSTRLYAYGIPNVGTVYQNATIAAGVITATKNVVEVTSESGTADDLATIGGLNTGDRVIIRAAATHTITLKHGTGNIEFNDSTDRAISGNKAIELWKNGSVLVNLSW
jgi:hypothetical protein